MHTMSAQFRTCICKLNSRESFTILQKHKYANHLIYSRLENYITATGILKQTLIKIVECQYVIRHYSTSIRFIDNN